MSQNLDHFRTIFFEECSDLLATAENHLSRLSDESHSDEDIHAIFRAVHSVKGGAGTFGFEELVKFAHIFETALDLLRSGSYEITYDLTEILLRANDVLVVLIQNAENGTSSTPPQLDSVRQNLLKFIESSPSEENTKKTSSQASTTQPSLKNSQAYKISFVPNIDLMRFGNEPFLILRELKRLSEKDTFSSKAHTEKLPKLSDYNPENCYLSWDISLNSDATKQRIEECFEFVIDDALVTINASDASFSKESEEGSLENKSTQSPKNSVADTIASLKNQGSTPSPSPSQGKTAEPQDASTTQSVHSIRVELDRIDRLVNTVGEMVIKQAMLLDCAQILNTTITDKSFGGLLKGLDELTSHTRELQESVMSIRAQPVKAVFARMPRLVRELATELGKDVRLEMDGENTEIDKTVIERLGEPLTHMIRNAVDHGIETIAARRSAGKPPHGTIHLSAAHKSGRIVICIKDDGQGINRERVLKKARDQGIISADITPSGEEIDQLIFHPGFSTASEITNISGRGVGMDVVKKSIQALGGRISIQSIEGQGCTFNLMLPLTLAVLDGMLVNVGKECFVIPIIHILETIRPAKNHVHPLVGGMQILDVRNKNIPLVYLHEAFGIDGAITDPTQGIVVIVETEGGAEIGLVVDELVAQQQVFLKSLEANSDPIHGISAATILGNGRVSLILDVNALRNQPTH